MQLDNFLLFETDLCLKVTLSLTVSMTTRRVTMYLLVSPTDVRRVPVLHEAASLSVKKI